MEGEEEFRNLTAEECQNRADKMFKHAADLPRGPEKEATLSVAHAYLNLAKIKGLIDKTN